MDIIIQEDYKQCSTCKGNKHVCFFPKDKNSKDGYRYQCKSCISQKNKRNQHPVKKRHIENLPDGHKRCTRCKEVKVLDCFHRNFKMRDKHNSHCRECDKGLDHRTRQEQNDAKLKQTYGLSRAEYNEMLVAQEGVCACCGNPETVAHAGVVLSLSVDHCHVTDAIRGLLCQRCNRALGLLCEDPYRIEAMIAYIQKGQCDSVIEVLRKTSGVSVGEVANTCVVSDKKKCVRCGDYKPLDNFGKDKHSPDGLVYRCKTCIKLGKKPVEVFAEGYKKCSKCGQVKILDDFYCDAHARDKRFTYCKACFRGLERNTPENGRDTKLRSAYQLSLKEYDEINKKQSGTCASCGKSEDILLRGKVIPLCVDHSHSTGIVRGLLCTRCNRALGVLQEDIGKMKSLLKYTWDRVLY